MISILIIAKRYNAVKMKLALQILFSDNCLMMPCICTKVHENTLNGLRVMEWTHIVTDRHNYGIIQYTCFAFSPGKRDIITSLSVVKMLMKWKTVKTLISIPFAQALLS